MYKLVKRNDILTCVQKTENQTVIVIPLDPDNTDYQEYLKWVAEGGVPLPPDSQE